MLFAFAGYASDDSTSPLLERARELHCASDESTAIQALQNLPGETLAGIGLPNEWSGTEQSPGLFAGSLDIVLSTIFSTIDRFPESRKTAEQVLVEFNYCQVFTNDTLFDFEQVDGQLQQRKSHDVVPMHWNGFRRFGFFGPTDRRFVPQLFGTRDVPDRFFEERHWRLFAGQCFPHPDTAELFQQTLPFGPTRLSGHQLETAGEYPLSWTEDCSIPYSTKDKLAAAQLEIERTDRIIGERESKKRLDSEKISAVQSSRLRLELRQQAKLAKQAEVAHQAELARRKKLAHQARLAHQAELAQQKELAGKAKLQQRAELDQQAELARKTELALRAELQLQAKMAQQTELALRAELELQATAARQSELALQAELAKQKELAQQARSTKQAQQAELDHQAKLALQAERTRSARRALQAERTRLAEFAQQAEITRQVELAKHAKLALQAKKAEQRQYAMLSSKRLNRSRADRVLQSRTIAEKSRQQAAGRLKEETSRRFAREAAKRLTHSSRSQVQLSRIHAKKQKEEREQLKAQESKRYTAKQLTSSRISRVLQSRVRAEQKIAEEELFDAKLKRRYYSKTMTTAKMWRVLLSRYYALHRQDPDWNRNVIYVVRNHYSPAALMAKKRHARRIGLPSIQTVEAPSTQLAGVSASRPEQSVVASNTDKSSSIRAPYLAGARTLQPATAQDEEAQSRFSLGTAAGVIANGSESAAISQVPPFPEAPRTKKDRKYHGVSGSIALSNVELDPGNSEAWSLTTNFAYKPIRSSYFFARTGITWRDSDDPITYYWGIGYNDWHKGTWNFEVNHWGPLKPGDGLDLDRAIATLSYKFKAAWLEKNKLSSSVAFSQGKSSDAVVTGVLSWAPRDNWFVRTLLTQPVEGGDPTWAYGFGYNNWRKNTFALEYNNWGVNKAFEPNFRDNALVTLSWKWEI